MFEDNFVHGDLHPGNILIRGDDKDGRDGKNASPERELVILDPGIVASLSDEDMTNFKAVFKAVVMGDGSQVY